MLDLGAKTGAKSADTADIANGTDAGFMADVVEESRKRPVIVDFEHLRPVGVL